MPKIVGVEKSDEIPGGSAYAQVACRRGPLIFLSEVPQPISETGDNACRSVGGAVIGNEDLQWIVGLRKNTLNRFP
jgi:hypothetical protein